VNDLKGFLKDKLGSLTRRGYVLAFAAAQLPDMDPKKATKQLQTSVATLCREVKDLKIDSIELRSDQFLEIRKTIPSFLVDLLLIDLDAFLHGFLNRALNKNIDKTDESYETLLAQIDKNLKEQHAWAYKEILLLAEIRNSIVHGNGVISLESRSKRLVGAGWKEEELISLPLLEERKFDDFLRLKRAVRTIANAALKK
jgi:hypothetical protein